MKRELLSLYSLSKSNIPNEDTVHQSHSNPPMFVSCLKDKTSLNVKEHEKCFMGLRSLENGIEKLIFYVEDKGLFQLLTHYGVSFEQFLQRVCEQPIIQ